LWRMWQHGDWCWAKMTLLTQWHWNLALADKPRQRKMYSEYSRRSTECKGRETGEPKLTQGIPGGVVEKWRLQGGQGWSVRSHWRIWFWSPRLLKTTNGAVFISTSLMICGHVAAHNEDAVDALQRTRQRGSGSIIRSKNQ
jgi:hypothetical protein